MFRKTTIEELEPFFENEEWLNRDSPMLAKHSSDEGFFEGLNTIAEAASDTHFMDAFKVPSESSFQQD